jgi:Uma2 family endonuclease
MSLVETNRFVTFTDWNGYLKFLDAVGDGPTRVTYDTGRLELMSPSREHEQVKSTIGRLLEAFMMERELDFEFGGSTTFKRQELQKGLEPDEWYWIARWREVHGREFNSRQIPAPDLVVDVTSSSIDRMELYRSMEVPEVWRYCSDRALRIYLLSSKKTYVEASVSAALPGLAVSDIHRFLRLREELNAAALLRAFRDWLRNCC